MLQSPQFLQPSVLCLQEVSCLFRGNELQPRLYCDLWIRSRRSQYFTQVSKCRHKIVPVNEPYIAHINATEFHKVTEPVYTNELLETVIKVSQSYATVTISSAILRHQNHHQQEIPRESKGSLPCNTS